MSSRLGIAGIGLLAAFGLAACGGGGGSATAPPEPEPTPQETCVADGGRWNADMTCTDAAGLLAERQAAQRTAITDAIGAARTAVAGVNDDSTASEVGAAETAVAAAGNAIAAGADLPDAEKTAFTETVTTLTGQLNTAKTSRMAAMDAAAKARMAAMAATGKALHAALAGTGEENSTALNNIVTSSAENFGPKAGGIFKIDAANNAGKLTTDPGVVDLKAGASVGSLGGWAGMDYALTSGTGNAKVTNEARVYTNRGAPKTQPFSGKYTVISGQTGDSASNNGYLGSDATTRLDVSADDANRAKVMASAFNHSGTQTHTKAAKADAVYVRGTYDGAPGEFSCASGCSSTNNGSGAPSALGGTWHFKPDSGAMVSTPDANYLYFGWWVSKDKDGGPTAASAFVGVVGDVDGESNTTGGGTLTGSATYAGKAAGKFAMSNPLDGSGNGGHFTADAALKATFGSGATAGMTGMIDNFMLNDTESVNWSVELKRGGWGDTGAINAPAGDDANKGTVWSINGNKAPASGTWSGTMYDETPGNAPAGDGSNLPTTVTGTFYSEFSTIGRMVGAFGANKQ